MKKIFLAALLLGALLSLAAYLTCVAVPLVNKNIKGSGNLETRTMPAPDFDGIDASRAVKVVITDRADAITIEADDNLIDLVEVKAVKGKLKVGIDQSVNSISDTHVTVTVPANGKIRSLEASSAAKIVTAVGLAASEFTLDASSAARIEAALKADKCSISTSSAANIKAAIAVGQCSLDASSASKIELSGSAESLTADLSSASKLNAEKLTAAACTIDTSSAAKASVNCTGTLRASASSGSSIRYSGDCETDISKSSGGRVGEN